MLHRLVLDTNTVMALWHFRDPGLAPLADAIAAGRVSLCSRADALEELRRVLAYRQFGIAAECQAELLDAYRARLVQVDLAPAALKLPTCRDRDDQKFLEIAAGSATHLLTRDKVLLKLARHRLLRERFLILTPERYCLLLAETAVQPPD